MRLEPHLPCHLCVSPAVVSIVVFVVTVVVVVVVVVLDVVGSGCRRVIVVAAMLM